MSKYSPEFILWDAEKIITQEFRDKQGRISDLHSNLEFQELLSEAENYGQDGKVHELVAELSQKYSVVLWNSAAL